MLSHLTADRRERGHQHKTRVVNEGTAGSGANAENAVNVEVALDGADLMAQGVPVDPGVVADSCGGIR